MCSYGYFFRLQHKVGFLPFIYFLCTGPNLDAAHLTVILQSLLDGLQGRVWEGKMSLLRAMKSVCKSCSAAVLAGHQPSPDEVN